MGIQSKLCSILLAILFVIPLLGCKKESASTSAHVDSNELSCVETDPDRSISPSMTLIHSYPLEIITALNRKKISRHNAVETGNNKDQISFEDIQQYDFSLPGTVEYKNSDAWSVFNSCNDTGVRKAQKFSTNVSDGTDYIITLGNRLTNQGTDKPELLVILPNTKEEVCRNLVSKIYNKQHGEIKIPHVSKPPNLLPHPQIVPSESIVTLPDIPEGVGGMNCFEHENNFYFYYLVQDF